MRSITGVASVYGRSPSRARGGTIDECTRRRASRWSVRRSEAGTARSRRTGCARCAVAVVVPGFPIVVTSLGVQPARMSRSQARRDEHGHSQQITNHIDLSPKSERVGCRSASQGAMRIFLAKHGRPTNWASALEVVQPIDRRSQRPGTSGRRLAGTSKRACGAMAADARLQPVRWRQWRPSQAHFAKAAPRPPMCRRATVRLARSAGRSRLVAPRFAPRRGGASEGRDVSVCERRLAC
jgi:hypothetical protein